MDDPNPNGSRTDSRQRDHYEERAMKFFRMILVIASLAVFCTGCDTDPQGSQDSSVAQADGGTNDNGGKPDANSNPDYWDWKDVPVDHGYGYTFIEGKVPDNKPATFYVCSNCPSWKGGTNPDYEKDPCVNMREPNESHAHNTVIFKDVVSFKHPTTANIQFGSDFEVCVERKDYLFVPQHFNIKGAADPKVTTGKKLEWKDPCSWGLAPNKTCTDSLDGKKKNVATSVKNGKVTMTVGNSELEAWVTDNNLIETDSEAIPGLKVSGTIQPDLSLIKYHLTLGNDSQDGTLTCQ